jgi:hypothetical protein
MPRFKINQFYRAVETFDVEAPDAATALKWMSRVNPDDHDEPVPPCPDPDYPGERDRDEYLEVIGHEVYAAGDDDTPVLSEGACWSEPERIEFTTGRVVDVTYEDSRQAMIVEVNDDRDSENGVFAHLHSWDSTAVETQPAANRGPDGHGGPGHAALKAALATMRDKRVRIVIEVLADATVETQP